MLENIVKKVFFYCLPENFEDKREYPHMAIALGEGLKKLGIELYSNENYWRLEPNKEEYLFKYDPQVKPEDCSIVVLNHEWFWPAERDIPENLFRSDRSYKTVLIDNFESNRRHRHLAFDPEFGGKFDFILKAHCGSKFNYPDNCIPWAFGFSDRILREVANVPDYKDRQQELVVNYRHSIFTNKKTGKKENLTHTVRRAVAEKFEPEIKSLIPINNKINNSQESPPNPYHYLKWAQTGKRHYPDYYQRLQNSVACACFSGWFVPFVLKNPGGKMSNIYKGIYRKMGWRSTKVLQWDSWRLWESWGAGCATFHLDFEKYGVTMPVMPENWKHYIGIDLDNVQQAVDRIKKEPEILEYVAVEGRKWAIEHYSPLATARRFLTIVDEETLVPQLEKV